MSDHFFGVPKGAGLDPLRVTVGTGTDGDVVELRVHDGAGLSRLDVLNCLRTLRAYFSKNSAVVIP
jgi:hypothetical protein